MINLSGELLRSPQLRFNYSSPSAVDFDSRRGLKRHGPYDSAVLGKDFIRAAVVYPQSCESDKDILINGLTQGRDPFTGFQSYFRVPIRIEQERSLSSESDFEMKTTANNLAEQGGLDVVLIIKASRNEQLYQVAKRTLLGNGIPNQFVTVAKLRDSRQVPWVIENLALACYAKAGGTPWVIASNTRKHELVIGVSRVQDTNRQFVVGFVTLFTQDGDFLFLNSSAPVLKWERDEYTEGLSNLIVETYHQYERIQGTPESITIHLCKRPGRYREVEAAERAIEVLGISVPYALVHLNDDTNFRVFDAAHPTGVPQAGLRVDLSGRSALLLLDGRKGQRPRYRRGVPNVFYVSMDPRSTLPYDEFPRLARQIHSFARVNWRGFNASAVPVTLNYSKLIARMIVDIGSDNWNQAISMGRLRDKAWFL